MAEQKADRPQPQKAPDPPPPVLGTAAASSDPAVHQLLAQRDIADRNGDQDAVKAATAALAALGVG